MKNRWKKFRKIPIFLVGGGLIGTILLVLVFCIPVAKMSAHVAESESAIQVENGTSSEIIEGYSSTFDGIFTDCLMLQNAIYENGYDSLKAAMGIYRQEEDTDQWLPADSLIGYLEGEHVEEVSYARYWHGYLVVLKPLLLFLNFQEIKMLNMLLLGALFCSICLELSQLKNKLYVWGFFTAVFIMIPLSIVLSMSQAICAYIMLAAMLFELKRWEWLCKKDRLLYFFLIVGMVTSYMDFLTYPVVTLGMPLVVYIILCQEKRNKEDGLKKWSHMRDVIQMCIVWGIGYAGMWAMKWLIGSAVLQESVLADAANTLQERTSGINGASRLVSFGEVFIKNIRQISGLPYKWCVIVLLAICLLKIIKNTKRRCNTDLLGAYILMAIIPLGWFAVTLNHSEEHAAFTFRILGITAFAFFSFLGQLAEN